MKVWLVVALSILSAPFIGRAMENPVEMETEAVVVTLPDAYTLADKLRSFQLSDTCGQDFIATWANKKINFYDLWSLLEERLSAAFDSRDSLNREQGQSAAESEADQLRMIRSLEKNTAPLMRALCQGNQEAITKINRIEDERATLREQDEACDDICYEEYCAMMAGSP